MMEITNKENRYKLESRVGLVFLRVCSVMHGMIQYIAIKVKRAIFTGLVHTITQIELNFKIETHVPAHVLFQLVSHAGAIRISRFRLFWYFCNKVAETIIAFKIMKLFGILKIQRNAIIPELPRTKYEQNLFWSLRSLAMYLSWR